jgi:uncharacterized membrane protein
MQTREISEILPYKNRPEQIISKRISFHGAEVYLILALLVFGLGACFLLPVSGGYDEETHLLRVWEMSALTFIPNEALGAGMPFPAVYWEMSYRRPFIVRAVEPDFWDKYGNLALEAHDYIYGSVETRSVYSPPLLLPQALVMRYLGRSWQLPALTVFYACRLVGLLSYLLLVWLAVRLIPFGKWILAILATSPVAILQAATLSADTISNGIAFLFIAGALFIVDKVDKQELGRREWGFLALLLFILFWGKLNVVPLTLLPFLLIRPSQFKIRFGYVLLIITAVLLFLAEVLGWNMLAYSRLLTAPEGTNPLEQVQFILSHPLKMISILAVDLWAKGVSYFRNWIAIYGFAYWPVPVFTYYFYAAGLVAALLMKEDKAIDKRIRAGLIIVFVITYVATILSLYVTFNPVGNNVVEGVQGRYFTTVMPLLFLALASLPISKRIQLPAFLPVILAGTSLLLYIAGMYLSYHIPCGSQYYQQGLCYQPNYKNWAPNDLYSAPLSNQLILKQEIVPECNGLTEVRVWVNATGADPDGKTTFVLREISQQSAIASVMASNSELPVGSWYTLHFQPDWGSAGKLYELIIQGESVDTIGPRIAYSLRQEYPEGKLYENEDPIQRDVIFQTGCIAGWQKTGFAGVP